MFVCTVFYFVIRFKLSNILFAAAWHVYNMNQNAKELICKATSIRTLGVFIIIFRLILNSS